MPLLKRKPFKRNPIPDGIKDDDEVYYCEQTKEIFKSYEEFFERVMLTNSVIWQCSLTGRPELTFAEALDSEKTARKLLRQFPSAIRGPVILIASKTRRSALKELVDDVFNFIKDRFFKDEKVDVMNESGRGCRFCKIVDIITPENYDPKKAYEPLKLQYRVEAIDDDKQPQSWIVRGESFRRDKTVFAKDKIKLFLKQQLEGFSLGAASMIKVKDENFKKYVTDRGLKEEEIFVGKLPDFEISKKLLEQQEKDQKKALKAKAEKSPKGEKGGKGKKNSKQGDITKYLNSSGSNSKQLSAEEKKKREENSKKFREEMEAKKKEKAELEAEKQKKAAEEKQRMLLKVQAAVRDFNQIRDDLELRDQRVIPKGKLVTALIDQKYFADFMKVLEFLHSFPEVLSISDKFPYGITMEIFERALMMKEVNGPLSDVIQVLLGTIFSFQVEEENEAEIEYRVNGEMPTRHSKLIQMQNAARIHNWYRKNLNTKINEMVMDSTTLTELLRMHFQGSGAIMSEKTSKYRFSTRGGYRCTDDPGLDLANKYPHIMKVLSQYNVFQLSTRDMLRVLSCLIDQILTYSNIRDVIEERLENSANAKLEFRAIKANEGKRERKVLEDKKALHEEHKTIIATYENELPHHKEALIKKAEEDLEQKIAKIDAQSAKEHAQFLKEQKAQVSIYFNHQTYLGTDRAFRNYYIFESVPGLFVEHDITFSGKCLDQTVKNSPALAHCTKEQRYAIIKQMVKTEESGVNDDKENKVEINGVANGKKLTEDVDDMQKELFMCNCDPATCIVHSDTPERNVWTYFHTAEEVDALIQSLNTRGYREKNLREQLESSRDLIIEHIKQCPINKLSVEMEDDEKAEEIKRMSRRMNKSNKTKYENANLNLGMGTDPNVIYEVSLRETILEFEQKLTLGCLGTLKVSDRLAWRKFLEDGEYCALDDNLKWGNARKVTNGLTNGHAKEEVEAEDEEDDDESSETASSIADFDVVQAFDSGNCSEMDSDAGEMKTSEVEAIKLKVKNLAMALLQIEQGIDVKFIRAPFGPAKELKEKDAMAKALERCKVNLLKWEKSLMKSMSYSQVSLHLNILNDSILWHRSALKVGCMICRRKNDPEQTLLCDECNKGWHMYCLKPKLTNIPQGDWFCPRCRPDDYKPKSRQRKVFVEEEEEDEDDDEEADDSTADSDSEAEEDEEEEVCMVCQFTGEDLCACSTCDLKCHPMCAKPPLKNHRVKNWRCSKCTSAEERSARVKRRRDKVDDDSGNSAEESEEEQPVKLKKIEKPVNNSRRSSKRILEDSDNEEVDSDDEIPAKKMKQSKRSSVRKSRRSSPEIEEATRSSRRSSKKFVEESSSARRASKRSMEAFDASSLSLLIDEIIKNRNAWPFLKPVTATEVPDYFDVIKRPMDFGKIKSKLNLGDYRINEQVMKDVELVFHNCDLYNTAESEIYQAGTKLEKFVVKRCKELNLPFKPSDMVSN